jgi:hypothetical protein
MAGIAETGDTGVVPMVWMDSWQMQCCGKPFSVGSGIDWTLAAITDRDFLATVLGQELAGAVTHHEEHHGGLPEGAPRTLGTVRSIRAVRCRYRPAPGQTKLLQPVPDSATVTAVQSAAGWDADAQDARFVGYLIEVDAS